MYTLKVWTSARNIYEYLWLVHEIREMSHYQYISYFETFQKAIYPVVYCV